jgi:hypothetical protein
LVTGGGTGIGKSWVSADPNECITQFLGDTLFKWCQNGSCVGLRGTCSSHPHGSIYETMLLMFSPFWYAINYTVIASALIQNGAKGMNEHKPKTCWSLTILWYSKPPPSPTTNNQIYSLHRLPETWFRPKSRAGTQLHRTWNLHRFAGRSCH